MRKNHKEYAALPASLEAAIMGMTIVDRGSMTDDDGYPVHRIMLMFAGKTVASWHHSEDETQKRIKGGWPQLTDGQLNETMRFIKGRIRIELKDDAPHRHRSDYMNTYGPRGWFGWGTMMNKKSKLSRLTVCAETELLDSVQQHRRLLLEQKGLRVSTSSTISALIRAGLEAASITQSQ